jgi:hypothetical protein
MASLEIVAASANGSVNVRSDAIVSRCSLRIPVDWMTTCGVTTLSIRTAEGSGDP